MVAGEFAVLEPYHQLLAMAVDRFVYVTIQKSDEYRLTLKNFNLQNLKWRFLENGQVHIDGDDKRARFVKEAISVVGQFLRENNYPVEPFSMTIDSDLDDRSGRKYGLGSSAAVVTATVTAILKLFYIKEPPPELIFKLAAIAHIQTQGNGSGADVAASTYGGVVQYASFQAEWLKNELDHTKRLSDLVEKNWTYLSIQPVDFPKNARLCIGWTGNPASTYNLVEEVSLLKVKNPSQYQQFLSDSKLAVDFILKGMNNNNLELFLEGIKQNRQCLSLLGENAETEIETPLLKSLCDIAESFGGAAKPSGAGGGDCGIAFIPAQHDHVIEQLRQAWIQAGITPLDLHLYQSQSDHVT